jgi:hypothetical protein
VYGERPVGRGGGDRNMGKKSEKQKERSKKVKKAMTLEETCTLCPTSYHFLYIPNQTVLTTMPIGRLVKRSLRRQSQSIQQTKGSLYADTCLSVLF